MGFGSFFSNAWHSVEHFGHDVYAGATGGKSWEQEQQDKQAQQAAKQGDAQRAALQAQAKGLHIGEYDPPSIQQQDNWQSYSQQDIHTRNQQLDEQAATQAGAAWAKLADKLRQMGPDYANGLKQKIASGWEGQAAQAAANVGDPLAKWMGDSANAFQDTGLRIQQAASAAGQVKAMVGPPATQNTAQQFGQGIATGAVPPLGAVDAVQQMQQQQQDQKAAQDTMARVLGATYQQADSQVPAYKDIQGNPVVPPPPTPPYPGQPLPPPVQGGGGPGGGGGTVGGQTAGVPGGGGGYTGAGGGTVGAGAGAGVPGGSGIPGGGFSGGTPSATHAAGAAAPPLGGAAGSSLGGGPGGGGALGGGAGGGGIAGAGGMVGGLGGGALGGRAGGVGGGTTAGGRAGASGAAGRGGAAEGSAGGARGSAGGRGSGSTTTGPGGVGGRGGGRDDDEHEHPSWLEENDDIWLNDMPKVAPPVFGE